MNKFISNKLFNLLLVLTIIGEFLVPWILKHFYMGYDSSSKVMSALGSPESPVRFYYNGWLIWLGVFLLFTAAVFFSEIKTQSHTLAVLIFISIAVFAVGAGIIAGLFSVNESKDVVTFASQVHGAGSAIGFMTLLFFPLLLGIYGVNKHDTAMAVICIASFTLAFIFFVFFIMGDKEQFKNTIIAEEGIWERASLLCMYIPFVYTAITKLFAEK